MNGDRFAVNRSGICKVEKCSFCLVASLVILVNHIYTTGESIDLCNVLYILVASALTGV